MLRRICSIALLVAAASCGSSEHYDLIITGGTVYRGRAHHSLQGMYLYGDYCSGRIWGLRRSGAAWEKALLIDTNIDISTFGEDEAGNVYVADHGKGRVYSIEAVVK